MLRDRNEGKINQIHNNEYKNITNNNNNNNKIHGLARLVGWIQIFSCRPILLYVLYVTFNHNNAVYIVCNTVR